MAADKAPAGRKQLLVVDDDRLVLSLMASGLTDAGYEVTTADSAEDAEAWLASGSAPTWRFLTCACRARAACIWRSDCANWITSRS